MSENQVDKIDFRVDSEILKKISYMQEIDNLGRADVLREAIELRYALIKTDNLRQTTAKLVREIK